MINDIALFLLALMVAAIAGSNFVRGLFKRQVWLGSQDLSRSDSPILYLIAMTLSAIFCLFGVFLLINWTLVLFGIWI